MSESTKSKSYLYIMGDGDDIHNRIEFYLLNGNLDALTNFSNNLTEAIGNIKEFAVSRMNAEVVYAGGDDIFFRVEKDRYERAYLEEMMNLFMESTGSTISFGIGEDIETTYFNLRRAKTSGKDKIIDLRV